MVCELIVISQTATMAGQSVKISENIHNMDTKRMKALEKTCEDERVRSSTIKRCYFCYMKPRKSTGARDRSN